MDPLAQHRDGRERNDQHAEPNHARHAADGPQRTQARGGELIPSGHLQFPDGQERQHAIQQIRNGRESGPHAADDEPVGAGLGVDAGREAGEEERLDLAGEGCGPGHVEDADEGGDDDACVEEDSRGAGVCEDFEEEEAEGEFEGDHCCAVEGVHCYDGLGGSSIGGWTGEQGGRTLGSVLVVGIWPAAYSVTLARISNERMQQAME